MARNGQRLELLWSVVFKFSSMVLFCNTKKKTESESIYFIFFVKKYLRVKRKTTKRAIMAHMTKVDLNSLS